MGIRREIGLKFKNTTIFFTQVQIYPDLLLFNTYYVFLNIRVQSRRRDHSYYDADDAHDLFYFFEQRSKISDEISSFDMYSRTHAIYIILHYIHLYIL